MIEKNGAGGAGPRAGEMPDPSLRFIERLVDDLQPVRPLQSLRVRLVVVLALWLAVLAAALLFLGARADLGRAVTESWLYAGVLAGLALTALSASIAALASAVPGRELVARIAGSAGLAGLAVAAVTCVVALAAASAAHAHGGSLAADASCLRSGLLFSALPAIGLGALVMRGFVHTPWGAAGLALLGAGALGAVVVHLTCPFLAPTHLLFGHVAAPLALALAVVVPLGLVLRRFAR